MKMESVRRPMKRWPVEAVAEEVMAAAEAMAVAGVVAMVAEVVEVVVGVVDMVAGGVDMVAGSMATWRRRERRGVRVPVACSSTPPWGRATPSSAPPPAPTASASKRAPSALMGPARQPKKRLGLDPQVSLGLLRISLDRRISLDHHINQDRQDHPISLAPLNSLVHPISLVPRRMNPDLRISLVKILAVVEILKNAPSRVAMACALKSVQHVRMVNVKQPRNKCPAQTCLR